MVALPAGFYIACLASTLPALFPTASRYGAMGLTFNLGVSLFGGTTPLFAQALIDSPATRTCPRSTSCSSRSSRSSPCCS